MTANKAELVAQQLLNANLNKKTWGNIIYNANVYADLTTAVTDAAVLGGQLLLPPGTYRVSSDLTVPENVTLWFLNGAELSVDAGVTVTINGPIDAELTQIFEYSHVGGVRFSGKTTQIFPEWWGAKDDNITNSTFAISEAIEAANAISAELIFAGYGIYRIYAGQSPIIRTNVKGSNACIGSIDATDAHLLTVDYINSLYTNRTFELRGLIGYACANIEAQFPTDKKGIGLLIRKSSSSFFKINSVKGFATGVYLHGGLDNSTIGTNEFEINQIMFNGAGVICTSGTSDNKQCESNRFKINYMAVNGYAVMLTSSPNSATSTCNNNTFDISVLEINHEANNTAFYLDGVNTFKNILKVTTSLGPPHATPGKHIQSNLAHDNYFELCYLDLTLVDMNAGNIFNNAAKEFGYPGSTNEKARSMIHVFGAPPPSGYWRRGDIAWNSAVFAGGPMGWMCVADGSPGTWKVMPNVAP